MSDDSFIREVDEELRHDQLKNLWNRFGNLLIAAAVLIVVMTAGYRGWQYYQQNAAASSGDRYLATLDETEEASTIEALEELVEDGSGRYPSLARMRIAIERAQSDPDAAVVLFDEIAADSGVPEPFRSVARLRAGLLAVDSESYEEVRTRLETLAEAGEPYRLLAREGLGLAAMKAGADREAAQYFQQIVDDEGASGNVQARARIMLDLLQGRGAAPSG